MDAPGPGSVKRCGRCKKTLPTADFGKNRSHADGLAHECRPCRRAWSTANRDKVLQQRKASYQRHRQAAIDRAKKWREEHREYYRQWQKEYTRRRAPEIAAKQREQLYGLTEDQYQDLLQSQGNRCACCGCYFGRLVTAVVDHDHLDNALRGLLCNRCNLAIGMFSDSVVNVLKAARYLLLHGCIEEHAGKLDWAKSQAKEIIDEIAANGWRPRSGGQS